MTTKNLKQLKEEALTWIDGDDPRLGPDMKFLSVHVPALDKASVEVMEKMLEDRFRRHPRPTERAGER